MKEWSITVSLEVRQCLSHLIGTEVGEGGWIQATLPLHLGGLGLIDPCRVLFSAYTSAFLQFTDSLAILSQALDKIIIPSDVLEAMAGLHKASNSTSVELVSWLSCSWLNPSPTPLQRKQKHWSDLTHKILASELLLSSAAQDKCRLMRHASPHTGAWLLFRHITCGRCSQRLSTLRFLNGGWGYLSS